MHDREELERQHRERDHMVDINKLIPAAPSRVFIASKDIKAEVLVLIDAKLEEYKEYGATTEALKDLKSRVSKL